MKFLVSLPSELTVEATKLEWADRDEPVVPWFPVGIGNVFVSCTTFRKATHATVRDIQQDPDDLAERLIHEYPGLPRELHEAYVYRIAKTAAGLPPGGRYRVMTTQDTATLQNVETADVISLWTKQPG